MRVTAAGVEDRFTSGPGGTGGLVRGDLLDPVPVLVGGHGARSTRVGARLSTQSSEGSTVDLQVVDGVGETRARSVREGLSRLAESSILERYV